MRLPKSFADTVWNPLPETENLMKPSQPIIQHLYTADPSAHVFQGRLYLYPSHDRDAGIPEDDTGAHFGMRDYHVFSLDQVGGEVTDHGVALDIDQVPWADQQMWAPDATEKDGLYYFFFPAKDPHGIFRIGVASSQDPTGPFQARPQPIPGSFSIDPAIFKDKEDAYYLYFGGIWGGQLQRWRGEEYDPQGEEPADDQPALGPRVAKMDENLSNFAEDPREIQILSPEGSPILAGDHDRRFFEAAWMHTYQGKYYLSYSTGDTHYLVYAIGNNPYGPFTYAGRILEPVWGWTTHHSIVEFQGKWWLFYHDCTLSRGITHLRNVKVVELTYDSEGKIIPPILSENHP